MVSPMPPARFDRGARRLALWGLTTVSTVVLLFSYRTSTSSQMPAADGTTGTTTTTGAAPAPSASGASATNAAKAGSTYSGTVTGTAADTRWGPVQVKVTLASGKITAVDVVEEPDSNDRDQEINAEAVPQLVQETLQAQNAQIDMVSGATYTSQGYVTSLQSALDQAGVA
jgi:uncharacterized protein with FMN-binding domain